MIDHACQQAASERITAESTAFVAQLTKDQPLLLSSLQRFVSDIEANHVELAIVQRHGCQVSMKNEPQKG